MFARLTSLVRACSMVVSANSQHGRCKVAFPDFAKRIRRSDHTSRAFRPISHSIGGIPC